MVSEMGEDLPILKGILNGVVKYHNARMYFFYLDFFTNLTIIFLINNLSGLRIRSCYKCYEIA